MSRAQLSLLGALWHHPELSYSSAGTAATAFEVVVFQKKGTIEQPVVFHCVVWGDRAEQNFLEINEMYEKNLRYLISVQGEYYQFEYASRYGSTGPDGELGMLLVKQFHVVEKWQEDSASWTHPLDLEREGAREDRAADLVEYDQAFVPRGRMQLSLVGKVRRHPETNTTPDGSLLTTFQVEVRQKRGGPQITLGVQCVANGNLGKQIMQHVKADQLISLDGACSYDWWRDEQGHGHITLTIRVRQFHLVESHSDDPSSGMHLDSKFLEEIGALDEGERAGNCIFRLFCPQGPSFPVGSHQHLMIS